LAKVAKTGRSSSPATAKAAFSSLRLRKSAIKLQCRQNLAAEVLAAAKAVREVLAPAALRQKVVRLLVVRLPAVTAAARVALPLVVPADRAAPAVLAAEVPHRNR